MIWNRNRKERALLALLQERGPCRKGQGSPPRFLPYLKKRHEGQFSFYSLGIYCTCRSSMESGSSMDCSLRKRFNGNVSVSSKRQDWATCALAGAPPVLGSVPFGETTPPRSEGVLPNTPSPSSYPRSAVRSRSPWVGPSLEDEDLGVLSRSREAELSGKEAPWRRKKVTTSSRGANRSPPSP